MLQVATENELIGRSEAFEQAMNENALAQFCDYKVSSSEGEDQETWMYLRILFEADPKRCSTILSKATASVNLAHGMFVPEMYSTICLFTFAASTQLSSL